MKILVTGAKGFIGKNLIAELRQHPENEVYEYDIESDEKLLDMYCRDCEFVFNLAGINRPQNNEEFMTGNCGFASLLINKLEQYSNKATVMNSSSIQASLENPYGLSKRAGEEVMYEYGRRTGAMVYIYRFPNVFGKWCRPNYNSAVATFCNNIAAGLPITVNDRSTVMHLVYIDDLVEELLQALSGHPHVNSDGYCFVPVTYERTLGEIVNLLFSFRESRTNLMIPDMTVGEFETKLYSTYLSYLPKDQFSYPVTVHEDERGSFTELFKSVDRGQVSVNVAKPGISKGNHWHRSKNEKFVVVSGEASVKFRKYGDLEVIEYKVSGSKHEIIDIPTGYSHCITNIGTEDLVTLMWCNECFNPGKPDTVTETT